VTPTANPDLIDRIADALPANVRADWYKELRHCRSLPENDEMLRILRAMQFLTLLMEQVPARVVIERERLEQLLTAALREVKTTLKSSEASRVQMDQRLVKLPESIAAGIKPESIAAKINESLHQEFIRSTIPETARALAVTAEQMKKISSEFGASASTLGNSYHGAVEEARRAIAKIEETTSRAANTATRAAKDLSSTLHREYRWSLFTLTSFALLMGLLLGMLFMQWLQQPAQNVESASAPATQSAPPIKTKNKK
jgi:hypothetical protein